MRLSSEIYKNISSANIQNKWPAILTLRDMVPPQEITMWCFGGCLGHEELWTQGCLPENKLSALRVKTDIEVSSEKF